jgi:hypothetical protein
MRIAISRTETREQVRFLLEEGLFVAEIADVLEVSRPTVCYHKRKLGYEMRADYGRRYDWAEINRYYQVGHTKRQCVDRFGFSAWAWTYAVKRGAIAPRPQELPLEKLFAADTPRSRNNLKKRLLRAGLKQNRCEECGISRWRRRPLSLALHHVNGERHDNRLENLVLLCPNCHSQTPNFGSKNCRRRPE